jgi:hypothetical protein
VKNTDAASVEAYTQSRVFVILVERSKLVLTDASLPAGFSHARVSRLPAEPRYHTLGAVRIDFSNSHGSESVSYALVRSAAAAASFVRIEQRTTEFAGIYAASRSARSSNNSADDVPPDLSIPRWSWDGRQP